MNKNKKVNHQINGGALIPIGSAGAKQYYQVNANNPNKTDSVIIGNKLAVDNGEVVEINGNTVRVASADLGTTSLMANLMKNNPINKAFNKAYNTQEKFKDNIGMNDDGTMKARTGTETKISYDNNENTDNRVLNAAKFVEDYYNSEGYKNRVNAANKKYNTKLPTESPLIPTKIEVKDYEDGNNSKNYTLSNTNNRFVTIGTKTSGSYGIPFTTGHELGHSVSYNQNNKSGLPDYHKLLLTNRNTNVTNNHDELVNENYSDLVGSRVMLKQLGIWDASTGNEFTEEMYNKYQSMTKQSARDRFFQTHDKNAFIQSQNLIAQRINKDNNLPQNTIRVNKGGNVRFSLIPRRDIGLGSSSFISLLNKMARNHITDFTKSPFIPIKAQTGTKTKINNSFLKRLAYNIGADKTAKDKGVANIISKTSGLVSTLLGKTPNKYDELELYLYGNDKLGYKEQKTTNGHDYTKYIEEHYPNIKDNIKTYEGVINPYGEYVIDEKLKPFIEKSIKENTPLYSNADSEYINYIKEANPDVIGSGDVKFLDTDFRNDVHNYRIKPSYDKKGNIVISASDLYDFSKEKGRPRRNIQAAIMRSIGTPYILRQDNIPVRFINTNEQSYHAIESYDGKQYGVDASDEIKRAANLSNILKDNGYDIGFKIGGKTKIKNNMDLINTINNNRLLYGGKRQYSPNPSTGSLKRKVEGGVEGLDELLKNLAEPMKNALTLKTNTNKTFNNNLTNIKSRVFNNPGPVAKRKLAFNETKEQFNKPQSLYGISAIGEILGTGGDLINNLNAVNNLEAPNVSTYLTPPSLLTRYNINGSKSALDTAYGIGKEDISSNTASSAVKQERLRMLNEQIKNARLQLEENKANKETELINQNRINQANVAAYNNRLNNEYLLNTTAFNNQKKLLRAQVISDAINSAGSILSGLVSNLTGMRITNKTYPDASSVLANKCGGKRKIK